MADHTTHTEVDANAAAHGAAHKEIGFMSPEINLIILTWLTFITLLVILHKFAWKPILAGLNAREDAIRKAVEDTDKIKADLAKIEQTRVEILREAENKSRQMIEDSRKAAVEAANTISEKAREESKIMLENAVREIREERDKAQSQLKMLSAQIAVSLAGKILEENIDENKNRKLIDEYLKQI